MDRSAPAPTVVEEFVKIVNFFVATFTRKLSKTEIKN